MSLDKDVFAGLFFMGLGALGLFLGADYAFGTAARMGPGFLPRLLCLTLIGVGAVIALVGLVRRGPGQEAWDWDPLAWILLAVMAFTATIETLGLAIATAVGALLARLGDVPGTARHTLLVILGFVTLLVFMVMRTPTAVALAGGVGAASSVRVVALAISLLAIGAAAWPKVAQIGPARLLESLLMAAVLGIGSVLVFVKGLGLAMKMWPGG